MTTLINRLLRPFGLQLHTVESLTEFGKAWARDQETKQLAEMEEKLFALQVRLSRSHSKLHYSKKRAGCSRVNNSRHPQEAI